MREPVFVSFALIAHSVARPRRERPIHVRYSIVHAAPRVVRQYPRRSAGRLVVALALIPEAIAFSIIAGVDPKVGLYASFSIAVITAVVGGRPGMISAATAATAVLMVTLVKRKRRSDPTFRDGA